MGFSVRKQCDYFVFIVLLGRGGCQIYAPDLFLEPMLGHFYDCILAVRPSEEGGCWDFLPLAINGCKAGLKHDVSWKSFVRVNNE
jgi:hypothetical protein